MAPTSRPTSNITKTELTEEMRGEEIDRQNEIDAGRGVEDGDEPAPPIKEPGQGDSGDEHQEKEAEKKPLQMSPQDSKRQAMIDRFKRPDVEVPFDGDLNKPENLYGDAAAEELTPDPDLPEPGVPAQPAAPVQTQQPAKRKLVVRGQTVEMTEDEILAAAQKTIAADSYLDEAKAVLAEAKTIRAERAGRDPQHPEEQSSTQDDGQDQDASKRGQHPGLDLKEVVEMIQYGDPNEAAEKLGKAITEAATKQANEGHIHRLVQNDLAKSKQDLKAFVEANPDLAKDPIASNVIENLVYGIYREEIKALGVDEAQIPQDPKALADWHRLYRIHGHTVSRSADVLNKAKARLNEWSGAPKQPAVQRKDPARVQVNVDRTERRMAIPQQPTRSVAPRQNAAPPAQDSSRKSAVQEMRKARGQPVA